MKISIRLERKTLGAALSGALLVLLAGVPAWAQSVNKGSALDQALASVSEVSGIKLPDKNRVLVVERKRSISDEHAIYKLGAPWSPFQATGFVAEKGKPFTVYLIIDPDDVCPNLDIINLGKYNWDDQVGQTLKPGKNEITPTKSGIMYIANPHQQKRPPVVYFADSPMMPLYRHGKTTREEWKTMLKKENPYGMVEIVTQRTMFTLTAEKFKKTPPNIEKLCETLEEIMSVYARLLGLSEKNPPPNDIPQNVMHIIEVDAGYMYATNCRIAFHRDVIHEILDYQNNRKSGWGLWHEIGHMHQVQEYKFNDMSEVTVNIFSLEAQAHFKNRARIDSPEMRTAIQKHLALPRNKRDYHKIGDVFIKLAMFWQLRLAFGEDFYPKLHRYNREHNPEQEDRQQYFIQLSSRISGYDLRPFFEAWGLSVSPQTEDAISKLKLRKLTQQIWRNLNFSQVTSKGRVGVAPSKY
ncbi:MAG: M60 family metallopeptidase [Puniceicoccales bacterium]|jgi:hypothetical protein|nr:M60 family metallopeptidase [Puniceicoccales bacterium]